MCFNCFTYKKEFHIYTFSFQESDYVLCLLSSRGYGLTFLDVTYNSADVFHYYPTHRKIPSLDLSD